MCLAERVRASDKPLIRIRAALTSNIDVTVTISICVCFNISTVYFAEKKSNPDRNKIYEYS